MKKLPLSFYRRDDVLTISRELLGKLLVTHFNGEFTSGRIVEVEAYAGPGDRASHAWGGRRTTRNEVMYANGGVAYVYFIYGIHNMFNVVTHGVNTPHAILVRALEPVAGVPFMLKRTGKPVADYSLTRGPGNVAKAMGITREHSGLSLRSSELYIADDGENFSKQAVIKASPRIGVDYAGAHTRWPYRFYIAGNPYVSGKPR